MKRVTGWLTNDDMFFETEAGAELHEATLDLDAALSILQVDAHKVHFIIQHCASQIERFLNASRKANESSLYRLQDTDAAINTASDEETTGDANSIFDESAHSSEPVSDVGSSSQSENVRDDRQGDGA